MCNTGMRPSEAKNLRWRDVSIRKDREGRDVAVLSVTGKGKARGLVAPASVAEYLDRIRAIAKAKEPDDRVFTIHTGEPAKTLYKNMIEDLLIEAELRQGPSGIPRSTYSFRHTYATFPLERGHRRLFPGRADGDLGCHDRGPLRPCEFRSRTQTASFTA